MNILFISTESIPYCKTSELAEVVHGLAKELNASGHDVRIAIPCYRGILDSSRMKKIVSNLKISLNLYTRDATIWKSNDKPWTYLIQNDFYFDRNNLYGSLDDYRRFIFFVRSSLTMLSSKAFRKHENDWFPHIIQGYDWAVGLIPLWMPQFEKKDARFTDIRLNLSIYNIGRLEIFGSNTLNAAKLEDNGIFEILNEGPERINFLGRGILHYDRIVTVNPQFSSQNPIPESAQVLLPVIKKRVECNEMVGIRNGIDRSYNPATDTKIYKNFDEGSLENRVHNKINLQRDFGFEESNDIPMLGMVSRLVSVKGFDLIPVLKEKVFNRCDIQLIILAEPWDPDYKWMLQQWEEELELNQNNLKPNI